MKKLCKHFFICTIICTIWAFPLNVYASNQVNEPSTVVEYDLSSKERADYTLKNKNGEIYYLSIEPLDTTLRINNGTHNITVTKPNYWKAGFIATISSNKFVSVSSPYASAEPLDTTLRINNGTHNITVTKPNYWKAGFIATISSNKFVSVSSPYASAIRGSSRGVTLKKISSTYSKLTFLYNYLQTSSTEGFHAKIVDGSLNCSLIN